MARKVCSFCGRAEKDVNFLITGLNGFICDQCAQQAYHGRKACVLIGQYGNMGADSHVCKRWFYRLHRECKRRYSKERRNADRDPHDELHPDHDARVTGFPSPPRRKKEGLHAMREVLLFISFQFARYFSRSPSGTSAPPVAQTMCAAFSQCAPRPPLSR